jgi:hydroxymethylbilane synthase
LTLRIGTRGSALALAQAGLVAEMLEVEAELVTITTSGDRRVALRGDRSAPAPRGDKGRFVKEIEEALLAGDVDLAVHSAKDVPSRLPDGLAIVGVPARADPRDALCGAESLTSLASGAVVGTSSLRRRAQLLAMRPDLDVRELRGNVDTRLRRLADADYDALVLAAAGLSRLGRGSEGVPLEELVPAPGQGCLVLEARADDEQAGQAAASVTDRDSLRCLTAERALVGEVDASCRTPIGVHARLEDGALALSAFVGMPDGSHWIRDEVSGDPERPAELGRTAAERLIAAGAASLLAAAESYRPD